MRSYYCGELNESHVDQEITLCGWVHRRRDHGGVIFLDLRDRSIAQVVFDPDTHESFVAAETVRSEFVLQVRGSGRRLMTLNEEMPTGFVEVLGKELMILNAARTPRCSSMSTLMLARTSAFITGTLTLGGLR